MGFTLPLSACGRAVIAVFEPHAPHRCTAAVDIGEGAFVHGSDNRVFGRWNRIIAWSEKHCSARTIRAHGGEIVPGRLDDHVERIRTNLRDGTRLPIQLDIDVSMACPSRCSFCFSAPYRGTRKHERTMSTDTMLTTIREAAELGVRVVRFDGGGDPLTHPQLPAAIELCDGLGLRTAVLTAGDLLRPSLFPILVRAGTYVRVSLNAATDETRLALHSPVAGRYTLQAILAAVRELSAARAATWGQAARDRMPLGATSMLHPLNIHETYAIAAEAKAAGFDHLSFRVVLGARHSVAFSHAQHEAFKLARARVAAELEDEDFLVFFPTRDLTDRGYVPSTYFGTCRACTHRALVEVGPDRDVAAIIPCGRYRGQGFATDGDASKVFGYLGNGTALADTWMSAQMSTKAAAFPSACGDCIDRSANAFLDGIEQALRADAASVLFRFATPVRDQLA